MENLQIIAVLIWNYFFWTI